MLLSVYCLQSTLVLSFYIDVVLKLSADIMCGNKAINEGNILIMINIFHQYLQGIISLKQHGESNLKSSI